MGARRATALFGHAAVGQQPTGAPSDSTWTVEEWDGTRWRKVATAKGDKERDRLLNPKVG
ncbi:MAG: hypothetical protein EPN99_09120 [Frankiales bacterium]|nr:MAG: hypothetical protein EPN99_09120 [Frankiales bacterium]